MEEHQGLGNVKLHGFQFGQNDPNSNETLEIILELARLWIHRISSTTPMGHNVFDLIRGDPHHLTAYKHVTPVIQ